MSNKIKLTLPRNTVLSTGEFFSQVTEASNRGCILTWNEDYTLAYQELDTDIFFDINYARKIVESGGEVENYYISLPIKVDVYENGICPLQDITITNQVFDENDGKILISEEVMEVKQTYKDYLPIATLDNSQLDENGKPTYYKVVMSHNSELMKFSDILKIINSLY